VLGDELAQLTVVLGEPSRPDATIVADEVWRMELMVRL
jgi:hypothetical protein